MDAYKKDTQNQLEEAYVASKTLEYKAEDWVTDEWAEIMKIDQKTAITSGIPRTRV